MEFDRLVGSRIGVVNFELRLPFFGSDRLGLINFPYLPTDLVGFFDAGVAWSRGVDPELKFERRSIGRVPVFSAGVSARVNVLGALITEFYYAHFEICFDIDNPAHLGFVLGAEKDSSRMTDRECRLSF